MSHYLLSQRRRVAAQIRAWRGDNSQQEIADEAGVSRATVANWEKELVQVPDTEHVYWLEKFKPGFAEAVRPVKRKAAQRFPRLTPLRAFELLRELDLELHYITTGHGPILCAVNRTRDALANHVRSALAKAAR